MVEGEGREVVGGPEMDFGRILEEESRERVRDIDGGLIGAGAGVEPGVSMTSCSTGRVIDSPELLIENGSDGSVQSLNETTFEECANTAGLAARSPDVADSLASVSTQANNE